MRERMEEAEAEGDILTEDEPTPLGLLNEFVRAGERDEDTDSEMSVVAVKEDD